MMPTKLLNVSYFGKGLDHDPSSGGTPFFFEGVAAHFRQSLRKHTNLLSLSRFLKAAISITHGEGGSRNEQKSVAAQGLQTIDMRRVQIARAKRRKRQIIMARTGGDQNEVFVRTPTDAWTHFVSRGAELGAE
jgi:hypothetical protein